MQVQAFGERARRRHVEPAAVGEDHDRIAFGVTGGGRHSIRIARVFRVEPLVRDLIPRQEVADVVTGEIVAVTDDRGFGHVRRNVGIAPGVQALRRGLQDSRAGAGRLREEQVELGPIDAHQARLGHRAHTDVNR
jgi:hypothetical protein